MLTLNPLSIRTRFIMFFLILALVPMSITVAISYYNARESLINASAVQINGQMNSLHNEIQALIKRFSSDLLLLSYIAPIQYLINQEDANNPPTEENISELIHIFSRILENKQFFYRLRFFDAQGSELISVEYSNGQLQVITLPKMPPTDFSPLFLAARNLAHGKIAISDFSLKRVDGDIVTPHTPLLGLGTPLYNRQKQLRGILLLDIYARSILTNLNKHLGHNYLFTDTGYYLYHPNNIKTFGFEYQQSAMFEQDFPTVAYQLQLNTNEQQWIITDLAQNRVMGVKKIIFDETQPQRYLLLINSLELETILAPLYDLEKILVFVAGIIILIVIFRAISFAKLFKRLEDRLFAQEKLMRLVIDNIPSYIAWKNEKNIFSGCNRNFTQIAGINSTDEIIGKSDKDLPPRPSDSIYECITDNYLIENDTFEQNNIDLIHFPDGRKIWAEINKIPLHNAEGAVIGLLITLEDITTKRETELALQAAKDEAEVEQIAKNQFLINMMNELRDPLNNILGYIKILSRNPHFSEGELCELALIERDGKHLLTLVNDVSDLAEITAGKMELNLEKIHLKNFLENLNKLFQLRAEQKGIMYICAHQADIPEFVLGDEKRLSQILINLLNNALKFTEVGWLEFRFSYYGVKAVFEIEDTGVGISEEQIDKIFFPLQHVRPPDHREFNLLEGTGLGLSISKMLVNVMGGELQVKSQINKGSTFWFSIELPPVIIQADESVKTYLN